MADYTTQSRAEVTGDTNNKEIDAEEVIDKYEIPESEPFISFNALKERIRHHYELASDYYYSLWYVPELSTFPAFWTATEREGANTSIMDTS